MRTPLKLFWTFAKNMHRLRAQENLRWVQILSMPNVTEETRKEFIQNQIDRIGVVQVSEERDTEGLNKLKSLM